MLSVVCWLWKDEDFRFRSSFRYTPEHVNRLQRMVSRHLSLPHRFICMTDWPQEAFHPSVWAKPMWDDLRRLGGCYARLRSFSREIEHVLGPRFVSIDLDCVVTGSLDPLFDRDDPFVIWEDIDPRQPVCGSMWMMDAGCRARVYKMFDKQVADHLKKENGFIGTDQAWIASVLEPFEYSLWTKADGVYSIADRHFRMGKLGKTTSRAYLRRMAEAGKASTLPDDARIVFFHGRRDPSMADIQEIHPWITPFYGEPFETTGTN